jgi:hypothetical protein
MHLSVPAEPEVRPETGSRVTGSETELRLVALLFLKCPTILISDGAKQPVLFARSGVV